MVVIVVGAFLAPAREDNGPYSQHLQQRHAGSQGGMASAQRSGISDGSMGKTSEGSERGRRATYDPYSGRRSSFDLLKEKPGLADFLEPRRAGPGHRRSQRGHAARSQYCGAESYLQRALLYDSPGTQPDGARRPCGNAGARTLELRTARACISTRIAGMTRLLFTTHQAREKSSGGARRLRSATAG